MALSFEVIFLVSFILLRILLVSRWREKFSKSEMIQGILITALSRSISEVNIPFPVICLTEMFQILFLIHFVKLLDQKLQRYMI